MTPPPTTTTTKKKKNDLPFVTIPCIHYDIEKKNFLFRVFILNSSYNI